MIKLYLTLDNEKGNKIERVLKLNNDGGYLEGFNYVIQDMIDSMEKVEKENQEEIINEAQRITQHND